MRLSNLVDIPDWSELSLLSKEIRSGHGKSDKNLALQGSRFDAVLEKCISDGVRDERGVGGDKNNSLGESLHAPAEGERRKESTSEGATQIKICDKLDLESRVSSEVGSKGKLRTSKDSKEIIQSFRIFENRGISKDNLLAFSAIKTNEVARFNLDEYSRKVEHYLVLILQPIFEIGRNFKLSREVKEIIDRIEAKVSGGRIELSEIFLLLSELRKHLRAVSEAQKFELQKDFQKLEREVALAIENFLKVDSTSMDLFSSAKGNVKQESSGSVIVNDLRKQVVERKEGSGYFETGNNLLMSPFRAEGNLRVGLQPAVHGQPSGSVQQSSFFVYFQALSNAVSEFSGRVVINLRNNINEMRMTLFPPEIGRVFAKFESTSDGKIVGDIVVSTKEAYTLFQEHLNAIKENLLGQGFNITDIRLSLDSFGLGGYGNNRERDAVTLSQDGFFLRFRKPEGEYTKSYDKSSTSYDGIINLYA